MIIKGEMEREKLKTFLILFQEEWSEKIEECLALLEASFTSVEILYIMASWNNL